MTTVPRTRTDLLAARKAAAGTSHFVAGYAGAVAGAGVVDAVLDAGGAAFGDALATLSGNIAPISWPAPRSRNLVALVVMPAA